MIRMVRIIQMNALYSKPEKSGMPDRPCAMPIVKGLKIAPERPMWADT